MNEIRASHDQIIGETYDKQATQVMTPCKGSASASVVCTAFKERDSDFRTLAFKELMITNVNVRYIALIEGATDVESKG